MTRFREIPRHVPVALAAVVALFFMSWSQGFADYTFTYASTDGSVVASGTLLTPFNGYGPLPVAGGTITVAVTGAGTGLTPVTGSDYGALFPISPTQGTVGYPIYSTSATGAFWYDNQLIPGSGLPSSQMLTSYGLLFTVGNSGSPGYMEINLYNLYGWQNYNSTPVSTSYQLVEWTQAGWSPYGAGGLTGTFTLTAVPSAAPIPSATWLLGPGLLGLAGIRRRLKK
jgi:hypothetical protein